MAASEPSQNFSTTMMQDDNTEDTSGKEVRPPIIPSNIGSIYCAKGSYNLKGFYNDLIERLDKQKALIKKVEENSIKSLQFASTMNSAYFDRK